MPSSGYPRAPLWRTGRVRVEERRCGHNPSASPLASHRSPVSSSGKAVFEDEMGLNAVSSLGKAVYEDEMGTAEGSVTVTPLPHSGLAPESPEPTGCPPSRGQKRPYMLTKSFFGA